MYRKNDEVRYDDFIKAAEMKSLADKAAGKMSAPLIKTGSLLPHEIIDESLKTYTHLCYLKEKIEAGEDVSPEHMRAAESLNSQLNLQFDGLVSTIKTAMSKGEGVGRCVPVIDVSGSMSGLPMSVGCALGLLLSSATPMSSKWYGRVFTFHETPTLATVLTPADSVGGEGEPKLIDIGEIVQRIKKMDWGMSTNILATMKLFIEHEKSQVDVEIDKDPVTLITFSDMVTPFYHINNPKYISKKSRNLRLNTS